MADDSIPGALHKATSHGDIMNALIGASHRTNEWRKGFEERLRVVETTQQDMLSELRANTAETRAARQTIQDVSDALVTARTVRKLVIWLSTFAAAVGALWTVWSQLKGGGPPPAG